MKLFCRVLGVIAIIVYTIALLILNYNTGDLGLVNAAAYYYLVNKTIEELIYGNNERK